MKANWLQINDTHQQFQFHFHRKRETDKVQKKTMLKVKEN